MQWIRVFPHLKKQKIIGLVFTFGASDLGKHTQCRQYIRWTAIHIVFTRVCLLIMCWSLILNWLFWFATIQWYSTTWQCYFEKPVFGQSIGEVGSGHSESWEAREGLVTHLPYLPTDCLLWGSRDGRRQSPWSGRKVLWKACESQVESWPSFASVHYNQASPLNFVLTSSDHIFLNVCYHNL